HLTEILANDFIPNIKNTWNKFCYNCEFSSYWNVLKHDWKFAIEKEIRNSLTISGNTSTTKRKQEGLREKKVKKQSNRFDIKESTTDNDEVKSDYNLSNFELAYRAFDPSKMWVLNSSEHVVEKNEIFFSNPKQVPKIDKNIVNLLIKYNIDNLPALQKVIFKPLFSDNAPYSTDLDYINLAYRSMYSLWRGEDDFISASRLEGWFKMNLWAHLIDPAFHVIEIDLVREEGMCLLSSDRKNIDRLRNKHLEFGVIEAGRNWEATKGTKLLTDSLKASKMLKDMINVLATEYNMKEDVLRKLQIAGIL
ncbi:17219_t:CDS:2, partial [Dentiscutata erythropus]